MKEGSMRYLVSIIKTQFKNLVNRNLKFALIPVSNSIKRGEITSTTYPVLGGSDES